MCFGSSSPDPQPTQPAPYAVDEAHRAVSFSATDNATGQVVAKKDSEFADPRNGAQQTVPTVLSGLNVKGM